MTPEYFHQGPVEIDGDFEESPEFAWLGCAAVTYSVGDATIAIDPYLGPSDGVNYVLCTHEHYDHCHVPTIRTLQDDDAFEELVVSRSCVLPSTHFYASSDVPLDQDLEPTVMYPEHFQTTDHNGLPKWEDPGKLGGSPPTEIDLGPFHITAVEAPGEEADLPSYSAVSGPIAQLGYLITDTINDFTIYHAGDLRLPYPEMMNFREDVDMVLYPPGKVYSHDQDPLEYQIKSDVFTLELIDPDYLVPIHYRHEGDYPIPKDYDKNEPIEVQVKKHQFPTIGNPSEYFDALEAATEHLGTKVVPLAAGHEYEFR